jgi:tetratricopeptide (TPR) repeat protein/transcriptional regulator with XRE-family HTH domain
MSFGGLLRQLRVHAGLTQEELAEAATVSARSVSDLERGVNLTARKDTARLLADALNLTGPVRAMFEATARGLAPAADVPSGEGEVSLTPRGVPSAPVAAVHALPRDTANFTGRVPELEQLMGELERALSGTGSGGVLGVQAVDGMAGIGKTTFAVHAAHLLAPRFPDGQFFLPLHSHTPGQQPADPSTALGTLLLATGIATNQLPDGLDARTMLWRNGVADKKVLLVLDDAASHEQVRPLLPGTAGSLVLITSRRRLAALEEAVPISLDTLPAGDAAELFTRLTGRLGRELEAVEEITRLCGFLPLAIRLIAGTLRRHPSWTATDMAAELAATKDRLAAMRAENLSVAAAFDLSYQDLSPGQQRLFRRLGLHPGTSFDAYAAAALDDASLASTRRQVDDLYDNHLIAEPARGRYRLHDLLGEHARSLAAGDDAADREAAVGRLLDYYLRTSAVASRLITRRPAPIPPVASPPGDAWEPASRDEAIAWLEAERTNLHDCVDYAAAHALPVHAVWIPAQLGDFLGTRGYWDQALTLHRTAADIARAKGDRAGLAAALCNFGYIHYLLAQYSPAIKILSEALGMYRDLGDQLRQADVLNLLGTMQCNIDDYPAATASVTEALALCQETGDRLGQADALGILSGLQGVDGDFRAAIASQGEALALYRDLGDRLGQARALAAIALWQRWTGDYERAAASCTEALALDRDLGDQMREGLDSIRLGAVHRLTGDYEAAATLISQGLIPLQELGNRHAEGEALTELGALRHVTGDYRAARASLSRAVALAREVGNRQGEAEALNYLGTVLASTADPADALARYDEALSIARDIGSALDEADALEGTGRCHIQAGDITVGETFLSQALEIYQRIGSPGAKRIQDTLGKRHPSQCPPVPGPGDAENRDPDNQN